MKPLFIIGGHDYRSPEERFTDRLLQEHEDGQHEGYVQRDCARCSQDEKERAQESKP